MNKRTEIEDNEDDVVVIEERDNRSRLYIGIAAVLGLALGGLIGSSLTATQWESTYQQLEQQYQTLAQDKQKLVTSVEEKVANVDEELEQKLIEAMELQKEQFELDTEKLEHQVAELEKINLSLEEQIADQKAHIQEVDGQNSKLNRQADMQATMFERSRELFQQELKVQLELEALEKEREELEPSITALKKECDLYLEGTSWDAKSDSCDKQDEANSRLSQVNQMIRVHRLDLKQMKVLSEQLGL